VIDIILGILCVLGMIGVIWFALVLYDKLLELTVGYRDVLRIQKEWSEEEEKDRIKQQENTKEDEDYEEKH